MYFVGIDISKYKHDCFICTETGEVIEENLSFTNTNEGFNQLLNLLKSLDNSHFVISLYHLLLIIYLIFIITNQQMQYCLIIKKIF